MSTTNHTLTRWARRTLAVAALPAIALAGCDAGLSSVDEREPASGSGGPLAPDVRYEVAYDQTSRTFSAYWPEELVAAGKAGGDSEYLVHYEAVHEVTSFDEEGYLSQSYHYLEGNADTRLPEDVIEDYEDVMPTSEGDPVVRFEMKDGQMRYYGASGNVVHSMSYDPEAFRVDPVLLDSMKAAQQEADVSGRVARNVAALKREGIAFRALEGHGALVESDVEDVEGIGRVRQVLDLRIGQPAQVTYFREDGQIDSIEMRTYEIVGGLPVMAQSVTYDYGMVGGEWTVAYRTEVERAGITAQIR